jgi:hypothetical protein
MLIWLTFLALFGVFGLTGYYKGGIRAGVSLIGLGFATFLALPLSPPLRPLVPKLGLTNQVWEWVLPPVAVFLVLVLIFTGLGFAVHFKVAHHFKYATDDYSRIRWERLNHQLGLCLGLIGGSIYALLVGVGIYIFGYPAVQMTAEDSPPAQRFLAAARKDLKDSGLDQTLASMDPMNETFYLATDLVGLLYNNPAVLDRLLNYPAFLALGERQEIRDLVTDTEFLNGWQTKSPILNLLNHPKVQGLINNPEISGEIKQVDLKDLTRYLKTGKSDKYDEERILGRWQIDVASTYTLARKKNPEMSAAEMSRMKLLVTVFMPKITFMATPDKKAFLRFELTEQAQKIIEAAKAAVAAALAAQNPEEAQAARPMMDARMRQRYGLRAGPVAETPAQTVKTNLPLPGIPELDFAAQGTWDREGAKYKFAFSTEKGKKSKGEGTTDDDRLLITIDGQSIVFVR